MTEPAQPWIVLRREDLEAMLDRAVARGDAWLSCGDARDSGGVPIVSSDARIATALERIADALERIATAPNGRLPARRAAQRREHRPKMKSAPPDEIALAKARKALERAGVR